MLKIISCKEIEASLNRNQLDSITSDMCRERNGDEWQEIEFFQPLEKHDSLISCLSATLSESSCLKEMLNNEQRIRVFYSY